MVNDDEIDDLDRQFHKFYESGDYLRAAEIAERLCRLVEVSRGDDHPDFAVRLKDMSRSLARAYQARGAYDRAKQFFLHAIEITACTPGETHPDHATSLNDLALFYCAQDDYARAEPLFVQACEILRAWNENHPDYATSLNNLGTFYHARGDYERAEPFVTQALEIRKRVLGEESSEHAMSLSNLGALYFTRGAHGRAAPLLERAREIYRRVNGEDNLDYAAILSNLAALYQAQGMFSSATPLLEQALEVRRSLLGVGNPKYVKTLNDLEMLYRIQSADELNKRAERVAELTQQGEYQQALILCRALCARVKAAGGENLTYAAALNSLGALYELHGDYDCLGECLNQLLEIRKRLLGEEHRDYWTTLDSLGRLYQAQGHDDRAEQFMMQALELRRRTLGEEHVECAKNLLDLGMLYRAHGANDRAEPLLEKASEIGSRVLGEKDSDSAMSLSVFGLAYLLQGAYHRAEPLLEGAIAVAGRIHGEDHANYATALHNLGMLYYAQSAFDRAAPLLERALEIRHRVLGEQSLVYIHSLSTLGALYKAQDDYHRAFQLFEQAGAVQRRVHGENRADYATNRIDLGQLYMAQDAHEHAEQCFQQAREITKGVQGENHPNYAKCLDNLGVLYEAQGDYDRAAPLFEQARDIVRHALGENHFDYARSLLHLGSVYRAQGAYDAATGLLEKAVDIWSRLGGQPAVYATILNDLGMLHFAQGDCDRAVLLLEKALEISGRVEGEYHSDYAATLGNLGRLYKAQGAYQRAAKVLEQSLELSRHGDGRSSYKPLSNLALLYQHRGDYELAVPLLEEALQVARDVRGERHPDYADIVSNFSVLLADCAASRGVPGNFARACDYALESMSLKFRLATTAFLGLAELEFEAKIDEIRLSLNAVLSLVTRINPSDAARVNVCTAVFRAMGLGLERQRLRQHWANSTSVSPDVTEQLTRLKEVSRWIRGAITAPLERERRAPHEEQMAAWQEERERLERDLARSIPDAALELDLRSIDVAKVAEKVPLNTVFFQYVRYTEVQFGTVRSRDERFWGEDRYAVVVIDAQGGVDYQVLGSAEEIDRDAKRFIAGLGLEPNRSFDGFRESTDRSAKAGVDLGKRLVHPLLGRLAIGTKLLIAPDSELCRLPFGLLPFEGGFLLETHPVSYVGSARDLLRIGRRLGAPGRSAVCFNPDFELGSAISPLGNAAPSGTRSRDVGEYLKPVASLPETEAEGQFVLGKLGSAALALNRNEVLKKTLIDLRAPLVLHLATHGFFLGDEEWTKMRTDVFDWSHDWRYRRIENPLLRSGLMLAGYNNFLRKEPLPEEAGDGMVNANDVSRMNLAGTELVVLSACDTGLGELRRGEGVMGLRRAFILAGAKTLVMSLWKVPDKQTRELMVEFYERLLAGQNKDEALRGAQLALRARYPHPYYWGAFICQGDPAPMVQA